MAKGEIAMPTKNYEDEWRTEEDLRALCRAKAVEKDPERMKKVKALAKKKLDDSKAEAEAAQMKVNLGEGKDI